MFAIGHFGLGYLLGKVSAKIVGTKLNLALLFTVSILPDFDLLFVNLSHRGPTHSLFFSLLFFLPFFVLYKKRAIPYFVALLSHSLIGDIYSNAVGIQLFWPFSADWVFIFKLSNRGFISTGFELSLFVVSIVVMVISTDFHRLLFSKIKRIYWAVPFGGVLGPLLIGRNYFDYSLPTLLVIPSLFYVVLFFLLIIGLNNKHKPILQ